MRISDWSSDVCSSDLLIRRLGGAHPAVDMTEAELIDATLRRSGYPGFAEMVERKWLDVSPSFERQHFLNGFPTRSGTFEFPAAWPAVGPLCQRTPAIDLKSVV